MKKQKEEAERYAQLQQDRKDQQRRLYLLRLYTIEQEVHTLLSKLDESNQLVESAADGHAAAEERVRAEEKEKSRLARYVRTVL